jgi:hypothetical protein
MSENETSGGTTAEDEGLRQIAAELKRLNDRFEPVPWYKRSIGFALVGLVFLGVGLFSQNVANEVILTTGAIFFVAHAIANSGPKK